MIQDNLKILRAKDVLKFVIGDKSDLEQAQEICTKFRPKSLIYVSPVFGQIEPLKIVDFMKHRHLQDWRLQVQLHKIIWSPDERGV